MKTGLALFDAISFACIGVLWGAALGAGAQMYAALATVVWLPLAFALAPLGAVLTLIVMVAVIHRLLPPIRPGRYTPFEDSMFFVWVCRFILQRALFAPGLQTLLFQFNTLRYLSLRALGAEVDFTTSMSSDATILDPWLLVAGPGATVGTGCLVAGHFLDRGQLVLGRVTLGEGSLLAARVVVGPGTTVGRGAQVLAGAMMGVDVQIGDGARIGAATRIERDVIIAPGVVVGTASFLHRGVTLDRDAAPNEEVRS